MSNTNENTHKEHRKRLKNKIKKFGTEVLEQHELFEALLTYAIPRKDTNPIGHDLLEHFGAFHKVIDAGFYDLQKVQGIGPESALFINIISAVVELYNSSKSEDKIVKINSTADCVQYFRDNFRIKNNEFMVMACLNKLNKVVKHFIYKGISETQVEFDLRQISNKITDENVSSVVLFHTHPSGSVEPSEADITSTQRILNTCLFNGINFLDHIILNEAEHYSFGKSGIIDKMKDKYHKFIQTNDIYNDIYYKKKWRMIIRHYGEGLFDKRPSLFLLLFDLKFQYLYRIALLWFCQILINNQDSNILFFCHLFLDRLLNHL